MRAVEQANRLAEVVYDVRGRQVREATRLESAGHRLLRLNIGNPAPFGFEAPTEILEDMIRELPTAQGYSDSQGILSARRAVVQYHASKGVDGIDVDDVWLGNGVSELIAMTLQALLDPGDEVLVPAPDYPLWSAVVRLCDGVPVHYTCDESAGWQPDLDDVAAKITDRTVAVVVINPNNPTGAVYDTDILDGFLEHARRHGLVVFSDEIYDQILYDDAQHVATASRCDDVLCVTFNGLSKAYRVAGFRAGWIVVSGPTHRAQDYLEGLTVLANLRLCPNVPAQFGVQAALGGPRDIRELVLPGGRLREQRDVAWRLVNEIPGVSCVKPRGAIYLFPRLDPQVYDVPDDEQLILDLLHGEHIMLSHGTAFNWPRPDHFRIVTLPRVDDLAEAIPRIGTFLASRRRGVS